ncbi:hypothetical protein P0Y35_10595 [Kiritimatiellaeota bacterium B1221]|nr:hypothetical protein [Kiritimatiellaeota bacterium B1221]
MGQFASGLHYARLRDELIYELADQYGLNRVRFEIPAGNKAGETGWEAVNDNADPNKTRWSNYNRADLDRRVTEIVGPFARHVRGRGDPFDMYLSYSFYTNGSSGLSPAWIQYNPGEYVEFAMSLLLRLKYVHGLEADYICILNEASYKKVFTVDTVRTMITALGPVMQAAGLKTKIQYPRA